MRELALDDISRSSPDFEPYRSDWRRDYARLIHSPSFRRLQGKTQLFPGVESDFFRNRLTHSLEVSQIAKSIAIRLNDLYKKTDKVKNFQISTDLVEFASLAHDLGHPPFGHQGEDILNQLMKDDGGFEGNAQTLRILTRIEKKHWKENYGFDQNGIDKRVGLNLCYRSLASILKYDNEIPNKHVKDHVNHETSSSHTKISKGYYSCDSDVVNRIKTNVLSTDKIDHIKDFKTIECYIMDIADDIAYSTYDLEDGFKAGFISPLDILFPEKVLLDQVMNKVNDNLKKEKIPRTLTKDEIQEQIRVLLNFEEPEELASIEQQIKGEHFIELASNYTDYLYRTAQVLAKDGYYRGKLTSSLVGRFIRGVEIKFDEDYPALSKVFLSDEIRIQVEILKSFTFLSQVNSPRLRIAEIRGHEILRKIFETLDDPKGFELLPNDVQSIFKSAKPENRKRIICDYIACMTDRYAIEFYGRLTSENPETIFKPF